VRWLFLIMCVCALVAAYLFASNGEAQPGFNEGAMFMLMIWAADKLGNAAAGCEAKR
jgi:hypothetical protein